jgi:hypothetical protein
MKGDDCMKRLEVEGGAGTPRSVVCPVCGRVPLGDCFRCAAYETLAIDPSGRHVFIECAPGLAQGGHFMHTHLYVCEEGGPMVLGVAGTPPLWVTCPIGPKGLECMRCDGARLEGPAEAFSGGVAVAYACASGHQRVLQVPSGIGLPESAQCPECDGLLLPVEHARV